MIRITGGEFRGRLLATPHSLKTRPSHSRLRQALFNSIQAEVTDARVLDLFAGSGSLGFEALSRGALSATFVEKAKSVMPVIKKNIDDLRVADRSQIICESVNDYLKKFEGEPYQIVLADPPYEEGWENRLLNDVNWSSILVPGGLFLLEWGVQKSQVAELPESVQGLVKIREKNYGDSVLTTYRLGGN